MSSYRRAFDEFSFSKIVLILILNVILKNGAWKRSFGGVTVIAICSVNFEKACIKWDRASGDQARYLTGNTFLLGSKLEFVGKAQDLADVLMRGRDFEIETSIDI